MSMHTMSAVIKQHVVALPGPSTGDPSYCPWHATHASQHIACFTCHKRIHTQHWRPDRIERQSVVVCGRATVAVHTTWLAIPREAQGHACNDWTARKKVAVVVRSSTPTSTALVLDDAMEAQLM